VAAIRLDLPIPPSVNAAYRNVAGRGRVATDVLKQWKWDAGWELKLSKCGRIEGPYSLRIFVPEDMPGDVDGRIKAVPDLLVTHGITPDDKFMRSVSSERSADVAFGRCVVVVESA
jgi:Holliday junction resolvase RusA-like endonuclease